MARHNIQKQSGVLMTTLPAIPTLTTRQMVEVDRLMIAEYGIQLIQMMENAGRNLAHQARQMLGGLITRRRIIVLCGAGNNGGGGVVAARYLHNWGADVRVILAAETRKLKDVPAQQWHTLRAMGVAGIASAVVDTGAPELVVDALIGYGLHGDPYGAAATWIHWANTWSCPILALDAPSGLDTTTGTAGNPCVRATATLTLALPKEGLLAPQAKPYVGELWLADIGVPPKLYQRLGLDVGPIFAESCIVRLG